MGGNSSGKTVVGSHGVTLTDLLVVLVMVFLLSGLLLTSMHAVDETARRVKCASNLRQIGQAILLYTNDARGPYPRTVYNTDTSDKPVWGTPYPADKPQAPDPTDNSCDPFAKKDAKAKFTPEANDVTAALYLLIRTEDITSGVFVCPSAKLKPWDFGGGEHTALNWTNFAGDSVLRDHLSYAYADPYPSAAALGSGFRMVAGLDPAFAVVADMGPGSDALLTLTPSDKPEAMRKGNSFNHFGDGQNVLYGDGHVEFQNNPFVGMTRDNIYTSNGPEVEGRTGKATLVGAPIDHADTVMMPSAKAIGQKERESVPAKPVTAREFQTLFAGTYSGTIEELGIKTKLTIDDKEMVVTGGPMTVKYSYEPLTVDGDGYHVRLSAPDTKSVDLSLTKSTDGIAIDSDVRGSVARTYLGAWTHE